jgi:hypothetical protein
MLKAFISNPQRGRGIVQPGTGRADRIFERKAYREK